MEVLCQMSYAVKQGCVRPCDALKCIDMHPAGQIYSYDVPELLIGNSAWSQADTFDWDLIGAEWSALLEPQAKPIGAVHSLSGLDSQHCCIHTWLECSQEIPLCFEESQQAALVPWSSESSCISDGVELQLCQTLWQGSNVGNL